MKKAVAEGRPRRVKRIKSYTQQKKQTRFGFK